MTHLYTLASANTCTDMLHPDPHDRIKPGSKLNQNISHCVSNLITTQSLKHDGESTPQFGSGRHCSSTQTEFGLMN